MPASFINGPRPVMGYESIAVSNTAIGPTVATIRTATALTQAIDMATQNVETAVEAFFTCETNQMRYRIDGTAPTSSEGHLLNAGDVLTVQGYTNIKNTQFIRVASNGTIKATYFK